MNEEKYYTFGWHGISFGIPENWELARETGNRKEGSVRLDGIYAPRFEVAWKKPDKHYNLKAVFGRYRNDVEKSARRKGQDPGEIEILGGFTESLPGRETCVFRWGSGDPVYECVSFCRECYRLVFMRYMPQDDADPAPRAKRIFSSLRDHSENGDELWSFLGLHFYMPGNFSLENAVLNSGFIRMDFSDRKETVSVIMISLAQELLEERDLTDIMRFYLKKDLKHFRNMDFKEESMHGHAGVIGRPVKREGRLRRILFPEKGCIRVFGWLCKQNNKIFIAKAFSLSEQGLDEAASMHAHIRCHSCS